MPTIFKIYLKADEGAVLRGRVTSADVPIDQVKNAVEYAKQYREAIASYAPFTRIDLTINSAGGLMDSALGLADALESFGRPVRVLITGNCHSAATMIAFNPCTESVHIVPGGSILVHMPKLSKYKNLNGVWSVVSRLGSASTIHLMQATYVSKTGHPRREVRGWMEESRRFTAQEAVDVGLADGIIEQWKWETGGDAP